MTFKIFYKGWQPVYKIEPALSSPKRLTSSSSSAALSYDIEAVIYKTVQTIYYISNTI